jgi:hypothetical protein
MFISSRQPIEDLLSLLFKHRREIQQLYDNKLAIQSDSVLHILGDDENKLNQLVAKNILVRNDNLVYLNQTLIGFFDEFLGISQLIQNYKIAEKIAEIDVYMKAFLNEEDWYKRSTMLDRAKEQLLGLGKVIRRNVIDLGKQVQHDYKTETNFKNKALKIEDHNKKAEKLSELIEETYILLANEAFFKEAEDEILRVLRIELKNDLRIAKDDLIERHQEILRYLNRVAFHSRVFQKLQVLKQLKDSFELNDDRRSNMKQLFAANTDQFFQPNTRFQTGVSLEWLQTSDGYDTVLKVAERRHHKASQMRYSAGKINLNDLNARPIQEKRINYQILKEKFLKSETHLFDFIWNYPYKQETTKDERIRYFCKIALLYEQEFQFTGDIVRKGKHRFAMIFPKGKKKTATPKLNQATTS